MLLAHRPRLLSALPLGMLRSSGEATGTSNFGFVKLFDKGSQIKK